jgi:hypothetical protein
VDQKKKELEGELLNIKKENQKKREKYEEKRAYLRRNCPSQKIAAGRSSIIMKSLIFE